MSTRKIYSGLGNGTDPEKIKFLQENVKIYTVPQLAAMTGCSACFIYDYFNSKGIEYKKALRGKAFTNVPPLQKFVTVPSSINKKFDRSKTGYTNLTREQLINQLLND